MKLIMLIAILTICLNMNDYDYLSPKEYEQVIKNTGYYYRFDRIPIEEREYVLRINNHFAKSILFICPISYHLMKNNLFKAIQSKYGIENTHEKRRHYSLPRECNEKVINYLDVRSGLFKEIKYISKPYNVKGKSYSTLIVKLGSSENIMSKPYSFIAVSRMDYWRDWAGHPTIFQWLPWKTIVCRDIVTRGEVECVEDIINKAHPDFILSYPGEYMSSLSFCDFLSKLASDFTAVQISKKLAITVNHLVGHGSCYEKEH